MFKNFNYLTLILFTIISIGSNAQNISGRVLTITDDKNQESLPGVNIYWSGTQNGTTSNSEGYFKINSPPSNFKLIASSIGFINDTIDVSDTTSMVTFLLDQESIELDRVTITEKKQSSFLSKIETLQVQNITSDELQKAACCNLSESFETNASVDVSFSDAVTGAKRIELLGLDGKYVQMMSENLPNMRSLSTTYGLSYIPGTWMESIQISKGTSTVVNGYESITGQINVEYKKPDNDEKLYINAYTNHIGKIEGNINASTKITDKISTIIFGHYENLSQRIDYNEDSFLDTPINTQYSFYNRWKYNNDRHIAQVGIKYLTEDRRSGQIGYDFEQPQDDQYLYGIGIKSNLIEVWGKTGYIFQNKIGSSIGFINNFIYQDRTSFFGFNNYSGEEKSYYANMIYSSWIGNTTHKFSTGMSYIFDSFNESINDSTFKRIESVPGAFFQYSYSLPLSFTFMAGVRADFHNIFGFMFTPRFHLKYNFGGNTIIRASGGKGYRTPNLIAENSYLLAGSRDLVIIDDPLQEVAWNYGISFSQYFNIFDKELAINLDVYRTDFVNQLVIDRDRNSSTIYIYNLDGVSFSNSYQIETVYELIPRLDMILAFRYNDVKMTINNHLEREPMVNRYKGLLNLSYKTRLKRWQFDFTYQLNGDARLPNTNQNPEVYQLEEKSRSYSIINTQISRFFRKWNIYLGSENLTGFIQNEPIIAANNPFGDYFDSSIVWGPIMGRKIYMGIKFQL